MIKRTIKQISSMINIKNDVTAFADVVIEGVSIDSRNIKEGNLFVPLKGEKADGHQFVRKAIEKGAHAVLWQKDVPNPPNDFPVLIVKDTLTALQNLARSYRNELNIQVVGVTGSNGKTTTKDMTASLLSTAFKVQKTEGNFNNHIGLPLTILSLKEDTEIAVIEMGMSGLGEISFLTQLAKPTVAIITNIGESHLLDLGSREKIAEAKLEILDGLKENGLLIYNGDEPLLESALKEKNVTLQKQSFGKNEGNTLYPTTIKLVDNGSVFTINDRNDEYHLPVLGTHNVMNALAAILCARFFTVSDEKIKNGFSSLQMTTMRMEMVKGASGEVIINDAYNASPTSMKAAIDLITELSGYERKIVVLGDMLELGDDEEKFHEEIGVAMNETVIDYVFTYGNLGAFIAKGALQRFPKERVFHFTDKLKLVEELKKFVNANTIVLVKSSRGMKLETVVQALAEK